MSTATVSRALRGHPNVAEATRQRVQAVADRLGYVPNPHASGLASRRLRAIGMVVPAVDGWFFGQVAAGAGSQLWGTEHDLILTEVGPGAAFASFLERADLRQRFGGLLLVDMPLRHADHHLVRRLAEDVPLVAVGNASGIQPMVSIDNEAAAAKAVQVVLDAGHRDVALIGGAVPSQIGYRVPEDRLHGALETLAAAGVDPAGVPIHDGLFTAAGAAARARDLLTGPQPPTAIVAFSDEMAIGVLGAARELGLRVPDDLSVVGIDDHDLAEACGLTTVQQSPRLQGEVAANVLLDVLRGVEVEPTTLVQTYVVRRASVGGPRPNGPGTTGPRSAS